MYYIPHGAVLGRLENKIALSYNHSVRLQESAILAHTHGGFGGHGDATGSRSRRSAGVGCRGHSESRRGGRGASSVFITTIHPYGNRG